MERGSYWNKRVGRRELLRGVAKGLGAVAITSIVGCEDYARNSDFPEAATPVGTFEQITPTPIQFPPPEDLLFVSTNTPTATNTPEPTATCFPSRAETLEPTATPEPEIPTPTATSTLVPPVPTETPVWPTNTPESIESVFIPPTVAPHTATPPAQIESLSIPEVNLHPMEAELITLTNAQRYAIGLHGLSADGTLTTIARLRSEEMVALGYFSHESPMGRDFSVLLENYSYQYRLAGENIARNNYGERQAAEAAIYGFMNSQGHRANNILELIYSKIGIGYATDGRGMHYFTQVFSG